MNKRTVIGPVHPNAGVEAEYRSTLRKLISQMSKEVIVWITRAYQAHPPEMALDALPAAVLQRLLKQLGGHWQKRFDDLAPKLAEYYAKSANMRSAKTLERLLKDGGITVNFKLTREVQDILRASIEEQVGLIQSIPSQYFTQVQGHVMRAMSVGGDLKQLTDTLEDQYGVTRRRAAFIARDQYNKATATITRARQIELGVEEAIWLHSGGGKEPRPSHVANNGKRYDVKKGWWDPAEKKYIFPGQLINCRCVSRSVIEGYDK